MCYCSPSTFSFWFSCSFLGWQVHTVSNFLRYSSNMCLTEHRKKVVISRSIHPPQTLFTYIYICTLLMKEVILNHSYWTAAVVPIHTPMPYLQKKKEKWKSTFPLRFSLFCYKLWIVIYLSGGSKNWKVRKVSWSTFLKGLWVHKGNKRMNIIVIREERSENVRVFLWQKKSKLGGQCLVDERQKERKNGGITNLFLRSGFSVCWHFFHYSMLECHKRFWFSLVVFL